MYHESRMIKKRFARSIFAQEDGVSAVIVALTLSFLMMIAALAIDFGLAYYRVSEAQNAADAAALAAGSLLPVKSDDAAAVAEVRELAVLYAQKNGNFSITAEDVVLGGEVNGKFTSVSVDISCEIHLNIARMFGVGTKNVSRNARAAIAPCESITDAAPLGVDYLQLQALIDSGNTKHVYLKYGGGGGDTGSYGAIDLDGVMGGGANDFETWLSYGYTGLVEVGENLLPVEKGNMAGATYDSALARYNACTHYSAEGGCTAEHYDPNCPRLLKVLVIEKVGTSYVSVKGFAAFIIEGVYSDEIVGSYVKYFEEGTVNANSAVGSGGFGMYNLGLTS